LGGQATTHLHCKVAAVVEEPVLLDGPVSARLHHEVALHASLVKLHTLRDDVLVAPLKPGSNMVLGTEIRQNTTAIKAPLHVQLCLWDHQWKILQRPDDCNGDGSLPQMLATELCDEVRQAVGSDAVGDNSRPRVLPQYDGRHEGDKAIAAHVLQV